MISRVLSIRIPFMGHVGWSTGLLTVLFYSYVLVEGCECGRLATSAELVLTILAIFVLASFLSTVFFGSWRRYGWRQVVLQILLVNAFVVPLVVVLLDRNPLPAWNPALGVFVGLAVGLLLFFICCAVKLLLPKRSRAVGDV